MKRLGLVLAIWALLAGCEGLDFQDGVKVDVKSAKSLPVQVEAQGGDGLPVRLNVQYDKPLPVKVELPRMPVIALVSSAVVTLAALIIAIVACFAARSAVRSAGDIGQSLESGQNISPEDEADFDGG